MCEFCQCTPGCEVGKPFEVKPCANGDLCVRASYLNGGIILFRDFNVASGYFEINFCPLCGRKISKGEEDTLDIGEETQNLLNTMIAAYSRIGWPVWLGSLAKTVFTVEDDGAIMECE